MTRVEISYDLVKPLSEANLERMSDLTAVYGICGFQFSETMDKMVVEYDATRTNPDGVDHTLKMNGLPVKRSA